MEPLGTYQRVLTWLCGIPPNEFDSNLKRIAYKLFTVFIIMGDLLSLLAGAVFLYQNVSMNLEEALFSLFHTIGSATMLYSASATVLLSRKFSAIFRKLSTIYIQNGSIDSFPILLNTEKKCEWICVLFLKYFLSVVNLTTIMNSVVSVILCYIANGHFEAEGLNHPFKFVLPWNQSTPLGYSLEIAFDVYHSFSYLLSNGTIFLLFISICLHHETFYEVFCNELNKLNDRDEDRNDAEHLCNIIRFHISVKGWFLISAEAYSPIVLVELSADMLILACCVFQLDLQFNAPDFGVVIILMVTLIQISILFVYCHFGKMATESYERMSECLYDCNWHELDLKHQKYFVVMLANTQRPIYYHGLGMAVLNLETFTKIIRTVFSCYMIFKTLTSG